MIFADAESTVATKEARNNQRDCGADISSNDHVTQLRGLHLDEPIQDGNIDRSHSVARSLPGRRLPLRQVPQGITFETDAPRGEVIAYES